MSGKKKSAYEYLAANLVNTVGQIIDPIASTFAGLASDVYQIGTSFQTNLGNTGRIVMGNVVVALPYLHWYRVQLGDGDGDFPCCKIAADGTLASLGARDGAMLAPDTQVMVYKHPTLPYGFIIGAMPSVTQSGNVTVPDCIFQGSTCGWQREGHYSNLLSMIGDEGGVSDFSADRPLDATTLDWTKFTELGGRFHLDPFHLQAALDEMCGLFLFYHDQFCRLAGHNLELLSSGHRITAKDDEGEFQYCHGEVLYPWEALGAFKKGATVHRDIKAKEAQFDGKRGILEPKTDDQQPFYRYRSWGGYLGQGKMREMVLPPQHEEVNRLGQAESVGVFREQVFPDGSWLVQSAKSVVIAKRQAIPVPTELKKPEDYSKDADSAENDNYKASGVYGGGSEHFVGDVGIGDEWPGLVTPAAIFDLHAYLCNWKGLHPFHYHKKDYEISEEGNLELNKVQAVRSLSELNTAMWLSRPEAKRLKVDHRYDEVEYFDVLSHLSLTDDGAVVLGDGYASEVRMVGGNLVLSCPGDIIMQPGRSIIGLAGDDYVIRAKNSVDITSSDKDVRVKAKKNVQVLAGNGGEGGILLESKATEPVHTYENKVGEDVVSSGVILKAAKSQVVAMASEIYLRTGSTDGGIGSGKILLDADKGRNNVEIVAGTMTRWLNYGAKDYLGIQPTQTIHEYFPSTTILGTGLKMTGMLSVDGGANFRAQVSILRGSVAAEFPGDGRIGKLPERSVTFLNQQFDDTATSLADKVKAASDKYKADIFKPFHDTDKIGNRYTQEHASVTLRNEAQYGTTQFLLPETHWQQVARIDGGGVKWTEDVIKVGNRELMPYPGKVKWSEEETLYNIDNILYDVQEGKDLDRADSRYEQPQFDNWSKKKPDGNYIVVR